MILLLDDLGLVGQHDYIKWLADTLQATRTHRQRVAAVTAHLCLPQAQ